MAGDFWGISAVFVPTGDSRVLSNLRLFGEGVRRQGLPFLVVELAFGDSPFVVPDGSADRIVRLRTNTVLWHKERLLNLGLRHLPVECRYVAWLDADLVFENEQWVADTRARLERTPVVQPFDTACWALEGMTTAPARLPERLSDGCQMPGFAATLDRAEDRRRALSTYERSGHYGFAWAAERAVLERHGLYDRAILGGGDMINAHAFAGDTDFLRGRNLHLRELTRAERAAIGVWGRGVSADTGGRLGYTPGRVVHLFHGPLAQRQYVTRLKILRDAHFDPFHDIAEDASGCWRWNSDKPELHDRVREYFVSRAFASSGAPAVVA